MAENVSFNEIPDNIRVRVSTWRLTPAKPLAAAPSWSAACSWLASA